MFIKVWPKLALFLAFTAVHFAPSANAAIPCDSAISFQITLEVEKVRLGCGDNCGQVRRDTATKLGCTLGGSSQIDIPRPIDGNQLGSYNGANTVDRIGADATAQAQDILAKAQAANEVARRDFEARVNNFFRGLGLGSPLGNAPRGANEAGGGTVSTTNSVPSGGGGGGYGAPSSSGISGFPPMPTKEQIPDAIALAKAQADWRLAKRAAQASADGKVFPRSEAEKAHDPEIRKQLINLSKAQGAKVELKAEGTRLTTQLGELAGLAIEAKRRSKGINSVDEAAGKRTALPQDVAQSSEKKAPLTREEESPALAIPPTQSDLVLSAEPEKRSEPARGSDLADAAAEEKMSPEERQHFRQARLRDLLRAQLKGDGKNQGKILSETFDGKLAREAAGENGSTETEGAGMLE
ncbi:MAG: hypothetical protein EOP11_14780, partial [Proteobacteria bacterium]